MGILDKVPGSVVYPIRFTRYGSHDQKEIAKKKGFCEWLKSYITFANNRRFELIEAMHKPNISSAEKNKMLNDYDNYDELNTRLRELYDMLGTDLGLSEEEREIGDDFNGINMGKSQKYIEGLINHARASFVDYMFVKFRRPDRSKVNFSDEEAVREYERENERYDSRVHDAKVRYFDRADLVNQLIAEHYKMAKEMGMKKQQVAFSVDSLPCDLDYEQESKFLKNNIMKGEKQLYDTLYEKYHQLFEESKVNPEFNAARLRKAEELMEMQKKNLLELKTSKRNYEVILANEEEMKR